MGLRWEWEWELWVPACEREVSFVVWWSGVQEVRVLGTISLLAFSREICIY